MSVQDKQDMHKAIKLFQAWSVLYHPYWELLFGNANTESWNTVNRYHRIIQAIMEKNVDLYTQRPNVHAMFHLFNTDERYGTLVNVCCSTGETEHKPLKKHAKQTNNTGVDKQLLRRVNTLQTVRFMLDGAYNDTHLAMADMLRLIQRTSSRIFGAISPMSLLVEKGGIDENGEPHPSAIPSISCLRMGMRIKMKDQESYMPSWAHQGLWIRNALEAIYATNPTSRLPSELPAFKLEYYKRISFVSIREVEQFHAFKADQVVQFEGGLYGKVICFFIAQICGISDYFCLIHPLQYHNEDPILNCSVWQVSGTTLRDDDTPQAVVVPLMYLEHSYPFFLPYAPSSLPPDSIGELELM